MNFKNSRALKITALITAILFVLMLFTILVDSKIVPAPNYYYKITGEAQFSSLKISINGATQSELEKLPGIGTVMAKRIIDNREKNDGFKYIEDLKKVKGIGEKLYSNLFHYISL